MRKILLLVTAFAMLFASSACGKKEEVKPSAESVKATLALAALSGMEKAYVARDMAGTIKPVSQELKSGYSEFQTSLRKDIETYDSVEINIEIDRVEIRDDKIKTVFHWNGTWHEKDGAGHEGRGNSVFVFVDKSGQMAIDEIIGDSPFGVVR